MITHPVIGVRSWSSTLHLGRFLYGIGPYSSLKMGVWRPGVKEAECGTPAMHESQAGSEAPIPAKQCGCGLYAYHDWDEQRLYGYPGTLGYISGIVRGWGRMQCHPDGWRSQYAEILALITGIREDMDPRVLKLAELYEVPTVPRAAMPHIMTEFGNPFPEHYRPRAVSSVRGDT